jgi:hypothetical protein
MIFLAGAFGRPNQTAPSLRSQMKGQSVIGTERMRGPGLVNCSFRGLPDDRCLLERHFTLHQIGVASSELAE